MQHEIERIPERGSETLREVSRLAIRAKNIPAPVEPVRPIRAQACAWCEKDEMHIPLQDCMGCSHNRQDGMKVLCSWAPAEKPCEG